jgi:hypothetical protein
MNGTEGPAPVEPSSNSLESLTPEQLAELGTNPEMLASVRAEVVGRLKDSPHRANFFTFRYLLPADDADRYDAFRALCRACWNAAKARHAIPMRYASDGRRCPADFEKSSCEIDAELISNLGTLGSLEPRRIVEKALNLGFQTDVDVANAFRQRMRRERDTISLDHLMTQELAEHNVHTLFDFLADDPDSGSNPFSEAAELIRSEKPAISKVLGERGWEVLWELVELVDNDLLPTQQRERERTITGIFGTIYGVNARQAQTHKSHFRRTFEAAVREGHPILSEVAELLGW